MIYAKSSLDRETQSYYWLTVYAHDSGAVPRSSFVDVLIEVDDVNDNRPQTARPLYRPAVPEASPDGTPVIRLDAFDHDDTANGALSYRISSGNPQAFFTIDPLTGMLSVLSLCTHDGLSRRGRRIPSSSVRLAIGKQTNARGAWSAADVASPHHRPSCSNRVLHTHTHTHTHTAV